MIRPEDFTISTNNNGVKATIQKISFWGSFYEAEVIINDLSIVVRMGKNDYSEGAEVFVKITN
jgi:iron(III) transport system ATP-binding protein